MSKGKLIYSGSGNPVYITTANGSISHTFDDVEFENITIRTVSEQGKAAITGKNKYGYDITASHPEWGFVIGDGNQKEGNGTGMTKWKYLKGSEKDFDGAPEWACYRVARDTGSVAFVSQSDDKYQYLYSRYGETGRTHNSVYLAYNWSTPPDIIAQREPITDEDDLNDCIGAPESCDKVGELHIDGEEYTTFLGSKYHREIKPGVWVDIYDVLKAWNVTNPALQHLIKKAAQPGERGHKTLEQDMQDIIDSAIRAKELEVNK